MLQIYEEKKHFLDLEVYFTHFKAKLFVKGTIPLGRLRGPRRGCGSPRGCAGQEGNFSEWLNMYCSVSKFRGVVQE